MTITIRVKQNKNSQNLNYQIKLHIFKSHILGTCIKILYQVYHHMETCVEIDTELIL